MITTSVILAIDVGKFNSVLCWYEVLSSELFLLRYCADRKYSVVHCFLRNLKSMRKFSSFDENDENDDGRLFLLVLRQRVSSSFSI